MLRTVHIENINMLVTIQKKNQSHFIVSDKKRDPLFAGNIINSDTFG